MSIFGHTSIFESSFDTSSEYYNIAPTTEAGMQIAVEAYEDISRLTAGLYIADCVTENRIASGEISVLSGESLMENAFTDFLEKAKKAFIKLKDKIVAWFKGIIEKIKVRFMKIGDFVKKYKRDIQNKAGKIDFYANTYEVEADPMDYVNSVIVKIEHTTNKMGFTYAQFDSDLAEKDVEELDDHISDFEEEYNITELKKKTLEDTIGEKKSVRIDKAIINKMINYIEGYTKHVDTVKKSTNDIIKRVNTIIKDLDRAQKSDKSKDANGDNYRKQAASKVVEAGKRLVTTMQSLNAYAVELAKKLYDSYGAILKKVWNTKVVKASASFELDGDSLLETSMKWF